MRERHLKEADSVPSHAPIRLPASGTTLRIGVTGAMACGKSYACSRLKVAAQGLGYSLKIVDADRLRAKILEDATQPLWFEVQQELIRYFGQEVALPEGGVHRRRLSDIVFHDPKALAFLRRTLDPVLTLALQHETQTEAQIVLLDWALLVEMKLLPLVEYNVILVSCSNAVQLARLSGGDLPAPQIQRRLELQLPYAEKKKRIEILQSQSGTGLLTELNTDQDLSAFNCQRTLALFIAYASRRSCENACA